ncbi:hydroxymethylglutaryl-CoA synthase family protein [Roseibium sp. RKSG952]|uniref:hydroxymethylglutaryl-CoA synthase family protein n=1 Tax=Roseibium sp. RKSG952 TaxID=2529384 RepID=UPI0012BBDC05|nr:3-oxoacyl-[acyl-carrier-protein] synthase III C-terminal domain-containing protein [Roseibium sp. RKSG952]MTH95914.1 hydroxymethylglutaryl-CoA synthase family protein [Roseibium sp. RKSG952]
MDVGILAFGGYVPRSRLQRAEIGKTHAWYNPGLKGLARGERAIANWDEDAITMAVEAARDCLTGQDRSAVSAVFMASTSFPFDDRQNAGVVADALNLKSGLMTLDLAASQRAGSSGLTVALQAANGSESPILFAASERRQTKAASPQELTYGDGAAALLVGTGDIVARFIGAHSETVDFVDHFRRAGNAFDYAWEERWLRDEGYLKIVPAAIEAVLAKTGIAAAEITTFCFPAAMKRVAGQLAKMTGLNDSAVADNLQAVCGETGAAHPVVMLVHALETAAPGDRILVTGFGQGCDALIFEATEAIKSLPERAGISGHLARRRADTNYARFLTVNGLVNVEEGIRAEVDKHTGLSTHYRNRDMAQRMVGGCCRECGTLQFPKSNICVNPNCGAVGTQDDHAFADKTARLNSFTADRLTYSPDPPAYYGMIQFEEGGRLMADFTDIDPDQELEVGMAMKLMFRVKDYDRNRGFRRYFWKAAPDTDAAAGGQLAEAAE